MRIGEKKILNFWIEFTKYTIPLFDLSSKMIKKKVKKDETDSEEEEVKVNVSAISEKVFLTWEKNPKAKGGKAAFIDSEVKKARDLHTLENKDKEQKSKFDRPPVAE